MPKSIDLGIVPVNYAQNYYFEIMNQTKDTFLINEVFAINDYLQDIWYKGNGIIVDRTWSNDDVAPRIILPNESRAFTYQVRAMFLDSISLSGHKLKTDIYFKYSKIGSDSIATNLFSVYFNIKDIKDTIFSSYTGFSLDNYMCPNDQVSRIINNYLDIFNKYESSASLDSIRIFGGDSIVNFYGLINNNPNLQYPKISYDSIPFKIKSNKPSVIGWFFKPTGFYEKKAFIKMYVTSPDNKHLELLDSVYVRIKPTNEGIIENTVNTNPINAFVNKTISVKESFLLNGCSYNTIFLDSLSFTDWERDEINIYSDIGFPLKLETGFSYNLDLDFTPKKAGKTRGKIKAHFRDETGNTFFRYCYITTIVDDINDIELTKENPLAFYPNPVNSLATLLLDEVPSVGEQVEIYNSLGTLVRTFEVSDKYTQVNTEGFTEGVYIARLLWSGKSVKFCVVR
ncbi:MAG: T9SS type A sorting domain-containing protein [Candidatus Kapabacteria bacterium]|nr:T9SS type A sorting domain-containing protein [Candidatus Kapabacteria bacterium]